VAADIARRSSRCIGADEPEWLRVHPRAFGARGSESKTRMGGGNCCGPRMPVHRRQQSDVAVAGDPRGAGDTRALGPSFLREGQA